HSLCNQACRRGRRGAGGRQGPRGHAGDPGPQAAVLRPRACSPDSRHTWSIGMSQTTMTNLQQAAGWIADARVSGDGAVGFSRVHTDSRTVGPGDLFVALKGERFDAHDFIADVVARGAAAVLVSREVDAGV